MSIPSPTARHTAIARVMGHRLDTSLANLQGCTVGFEFEFCSPVSHADFAELMREAGFEIGVVTSGYLNSKKNKTDYTVWNITGDSSLKPEQGHYAIEAISPAFDFNDLSSVLPKFYGILNSIAAYTGKAFNTGLHITLGYSRIARLNPIKLALFIQDNNVLAQWDRLGNEYAESYIDKWVANYLADSSNPPPNALSPRSGEYLQDSSETPEYAKDYAEFAQKALDFRWCSQVLNPVKYLSINLLKKGMSLVEFRGPGGDWLGRGPRLAQGIAHLFGGALVLACDPKAAQDQYVAALADILRTKKAGENKRKEEEKKVAYVTTSDFGLLKLEYAFRKDVDDVYLNYSTDDFVVALWGFSPKFNVLPYSKEGKQAALLLIKKIGERIASKKSLPYVSALGIRSIVKTIQERFNWSSKDVQNALTEVESILNTLHITTKQHTEEDIKIEAVAKKMADSLLTACLPYYMWLSDDDDDENNEMTLDELGFTVNDVASEVRREAQKVMKSIIRAAGASVFPLLEKYSVPLAFAFLNYRIGVTSIIDNAPSYEPDTSKPEMLITYRLKAIADCFAPIEIGNILLIDPATRKISAKPNLFRHGAFPVFND